MLQIVINGFAQPQRAPQGAIVPPLPPGLRNRHHVQMHTPAEVRRWQVFAKHEASEQMKGKNLYLGALGVIIKVYLPVPSSMSQKKTAQALAGQLAPTTRPDLDNYCKSVLDALSGVVWVDDSQVVELHMAKLYSEKPRVEITVSEMGAAKAVEWVDQPTLFRDHDKGFT